MGRGSISTPPYSGGPGSILDPDTDSPDRLIVVYL
jgi:hypothetical protein